MAMAIDLLHVPNGWQTRYTLNKSFGCITAASGFRFGKNCHCGGAEEGMRALEEAREMFGAYRVDRGPQETAQTGLGLEE
jgi:hypothetical protein